jgi:hypothetical protein
VTNWLGNQGSFFLQVVGFKLTQIQLEEQISVHFLLFSPKRNNSLNWEILGV